MAGKGGLFLLGFLLGALAGAMATLLLTPCSGDEMRHQLGERSTELKDQVSELSERGRIILRDSAKRAQEAVQTAQAKLSQSSNVPLA